MNIRENEAEIVGITHILHYACDKYLQGILNKCESNKRSWMNVFQDILANICYYDNKVCCDKLNFKIIPKVKLIHVYLCDFIHKLIIEKYTDKKECIENILEIKKLLKIIKRKIEFEELDRLASKINIIYQSKQIISTVKNESQEIITLLDNYISKYTNQSEKSEIFINPECLNSEESFLNFLDTITNKWMRDHSLFVSNDNVNLLEIGEISKQHQKINKKHENKENKKHKSSKYRSKCKYSQWNENEVFYLFDGIKKYGVGQWRKILDNYQFNNRNRQNLNLKYKQIIKKFPNIIDRFYQLDENNIRIYIQSIKFDVHQIWTDKELDYLKEGITKFGVGKWKKILNNYSFENRTTSGLLCKYKALIRTNPNFFKYNKINKKSKI